MKCSEFQIAAEAPRGIGARSRVLQRLALIGAVVFLVVSGGRALPAPEQPTVIGGPVAWLLAASKDLGPAHTSQISLTVALRDAERPQGLIGWAARHGLSVSWQPGVDWAYVKGAPANMGSAFGVAVHDYRSRSGQVF
ncbi:MAG: hypothetical protein ACRDTV_06145, partial [Mycobacterium sp.]